MKQLVFSVSVATTATSATSITARKKKQILSVAKALHYYRRAVVFALTLLCFSRLQHFC